jgi:hypothetical protein
VEGWKRESRMAGGVLISEKMGDGSWAVQSILNGERDLIVGRCEKPLSAAYRATTE